MAYSSELKQLIKRVEETRPQRLVRRKEGIEFSRMSLAEKENRLRTFHPSCKEGSLQELKVGPSKGYSVPPEICEILESWSRVDPDRIEYRDRLHVRHRRSGLLQNAATRQIAQDIWHPQPAPICPVGIGFLCIYRDPA